MSTFMHPSDGNEEGEYPSFSSPPIGDPELPPCKSTPGSPKKRAIHRATKPSEANQQLLLSESTSPTQGSDSPSSKTILPAPKAAIPTPKPTASSTDIDRLSPFEIQKFKRRNRKRRSWLQRLIKKFELEPEDMETLERLDQFGSFFMRAALRCFVFLIGGIFACAFGICVEKLRHESNILEKLIKMMGDNKLMTTLVTSATVFGTGAAGTAAASHIRKKWPAKSKPKNE